jgi:hypothetical protein
LPVYTILFSLVLSNLFDYAQPESSKFIFERSG